MKKREGTSFWIEYREKTSGMLSLINKGPDSTISMCLACGSSRSTSDFPIEVAGHKFLVMQFPTTDLRQESQDILSTVLSTAVTSVKVF